MYKRLRGIGFLIIERWMKGSDELGFDRSFRGPLMVLYSSASLTLFRFTCDVISSMLKAMMIQISVLEG
uniref:Uncharacterized protein n=1 Tax=Helianthus annuus TaxID=4232 RepID=A0A251TAT2_HELAN